MRTWLTAIACVAFLACAADLQAQPGGGRGGPPGGGFGGGFGGNDPLQSLNSDAIKEELEIVPEQEEQIKKLAEEFREEQGREFRKAQEEAQARLQAKLKPRLDQILLPHQVTRLKELQVQLQGVGALRDPAIAADLKITDEQKAKFEEVSTDFRGQMRAAFSNREEGSDPRARFEELRKKQEEATLAVLTAEQRAQFDKLKGNSFDQSKLRAEREARFGGNRQRGGDNNRPRGNPEAN